MKKILFLLFTMIAIIASSINAQNIFSNNVVFNLVIGGEPFPPIPNVPHSPTLFPTASLKGHTLTISVRANVEILQLWQNNTVVYQTAIVTDGQVIVFPDSLTGEYELILSDLSHIYYSSISL